MSQESHDLKLRIDATAAQRGSREFVAAAEAVRKAVKDLERDSAGAFQNLKAKPSVDVSALRSATAESNKAQKSSEAMMQRIAIASASALRASEGDVHRLAAAFTALGDNAAVDQLNADLARLKTNLTAAKSHLEIRQSRSDFSDSAASAKRRASDLQAMAQAEASASAASAAHASELDRLAAKYNPLRAASMAYARDLEEISRAETAGALSAQVAAQARERAATQLATASAAADQYSNALTRNSAATQTGIAVGWQLQDVLITSQMGFQSAAMIGLQQGSQLASTFQTLKGSGSVLSGLLAGFTSLLSPLSLLTIAATTAGAALLKWLFNSSSQSAVGAKQLKDSISGLNSVVGDYEAAQKLALTSSRDLTRQFGAQSASARELYVALANLDRLDAMRKMAESAVTVTGALSPMIDKLKIIRDMQAVNDSEIIVSRLLGELQSEFGVTQAEAQQVKIALDQLATASGPEQYGQALKEVNRTLSAVKDRTGAIPVGLQDAARAAAEAALAAMKLAGPLEDAWQSGSRLAGLDMASGIRDAGAEAVFLASQLGVSLATAQAISRQSGWFPEAKKGLSFGLPTTENPFMGGALPGTLSFGDNPGGGFGLTSPTREVRAGGGSGGGGGGASSVQSLAETLEQARKNALSARYAAEALGQGLYTTTDAARLYGDIMAASGGKIDVASQKAIASVDAITAQTDAMDRARTVQTSINEGLKNSFEELFKTGQLGIQGFADSMISALSSILADSTTKAFLSLFGGQGGTGGGFLGAIGKIFGFAGGGYTGPGGKHQPAGIVHAGEFVMSQMATNRIGVGNLDALHRAALSGNPNGGLATPAPLAPIRPFVTRAGGSEDAANAGATPFAFNGDINVTTNVQSSGDLSDPKEAAKLANTIGATVRLQIDERLSQHLKYGGLLNPRG